MRGDCFLKIFPFPMQLYWSFHMMSMSFGPIVRSVALFRGLGMSQRRLLFLDEVTRCMIDDLFLVVSHLLD